MKIQLIIFAILMTSCNSNLKRNDSVVKIVKTKTYSTRKEFDKLVTDKPVYELGYDEKMGIDASWCLKQFDKFNNVLYQEDYFLKDNNEESILRKKTFEYYLPQEKELSKSILYDKDEFVGTYIRNNIGQLTEIRNTVNDKLKQKTIYSYNNVGQRIKKEVFVENGLVELENYQFDFLSKQDGQIIKKTHQQLGEFNFYQEFEFEYNANHQVVKERKKNYEKGSLKSDVTKSFFEYVSDRAKRLEIEGYDGYYMNGVYKQFTINSHVIYMINLNGDIEKCQIHDEHLTTISCEYTYNDRKDWTKAILQTNSAIYIVIREITYL